MSWDKDTNSRDGCSLVSERVGKSASRADPEEKCRAAFMIIKIEPFEYSECRDGVFYKKL